MGNDKPGRRITIDQVLEAMRSVAPELARRDPAAFAAARREGGTLALLERHPDLRDEYHRRLNASSQRAASLKVKKGDWVTINGWRLRIAGINSLNGSVNTERVRIDGMVVSSCWSDGALLLPDAAPPRPDELETMEPMSARERLNRHAAHLVPTPKREPGGAAPLVRLGAEEVVESAWTNQLPERGLSPALLRRYWAWALETRATRQQTLEDSYKKYAGDDSESLATWRQERVIQVHMLEAVLALLHRIIAPAAAYLCDAECQHLSAGVTAEQLKRFVGSLEAYKACTEYESEENYTAEYSAAEMRNLMVGERTLSRLELGGLVFTIAHLTPGDAAVDSFEVRVCRGDQRVESHHFKEEQAARALFLARTAPAGA
jgi:hypothetical protein